MQTEEEEMTQDEIIEMARQADWPDSLVAPIIMAKLSDFAKLVAAKEREACALICERVFKRMCPEAQENEVGIEAEAIRARGNA
jgi:hypothetical protein